VRRASDNRNVQQALTRVNRELASLHHISPSSPLYANYTSDLEDQQRLQALKSAQGSNTQVLRAATGAGQIQPRPKRNAALGLGRPRTDTPFGLEDRPGITDVALGHADLEEAIATIALTEGAPGSAEGNGRQALLDGVLEVIGSGPIPPNPGEFMSSVRLGE